MKRFGSPILILILALSSFVIFQNCGSPGGGGSKSDSGEKVKSVGTNQKQIIFHYSNNIKIGASVLMSAPDEYYAAFLADGECVWSFTNEAKQRTNFNNPLQSFFIEKAVASQSGAYTLLCENTDYKYSFIFTLKVAGTSNPTTLGIYRVYTKYRGTTTKVFERLNVTEILATSSCIHDAPNFEAAKGVTCKWNDTVIYSRAEPDSFATYKIFSVLNGATQEQRKVENVNRATALTNCEADKPGIVSPKGIICQWDDEVLYTRAEIVPVDTYVIYSVTNGESTQYKSQPGITEAQAKTTCNTHAAEIVLSKGVICKWGTQVIAQRPETDPSLTYQTFKIVGGARSVYASSEAKLTQSEALTRCNTHIASLDAASPVSGKVVYGASCMWGTTEIKLRAEPTANGKGVCSHSGETKNVTNVTYTSGLNTCKTSSDSKNCTSHGFKVTCYWDGVQVYRSP